jgi:hypothetical protein
MDMTAVMRWPALRWTPQRGPRLVLTQTKSPNKRPVSLLRLSAKLSMWQGKVSPDWPALGTVRLGVLP